MDNKLTSTAKLAAELTGDPDVQAQVEKEIKNTKLVTTLMNFRLQKNISQKKLLMQWMYR